MPSVTVLSPESVPWLLAQAATGGGEGGGGDGEGGDGGGEGGDRDAGSETRVQLPEAKFALPLSVPVRLTIEPSGKGVQVLFPPAGPVVVKGVQ
jgi:hypothetical protein